MANADAGDLDGRIVSTVGSALQKPVGRLRSSPEFRDGLKALQARSWAITSLEVESPKTKTNNRAAWLRLWRKNQGNYMKKKYPYFVSRSEKRSGTVIIDATSKEEALRLADALPDEEWDWDSPDIVDEAEVA